MFRVSTIHGLMGLMEKELKFEELYEAVTQGIRVSVRPSFLDDQSDPEASQYVWSYEIEITNESAVTVQLRERAWTITDGSGNQELINGPGVVGEQPILNPGDLFRYSSGCPLNTSSGFMQGHYMMANDAGDEFEVTIPAFALDLPHVSHVVN